MNQQTTENKLLTNQGFTLIELLLVMAIVSILSSAIFFNRDKATNTQALNQAAQKLAFDIRKAQTLSLGSVNLDSNAGICGYGIKIKDLNTYGIFLYHGNCDNKNNFVAGNTADSKLTYLSKDKNKITISSNSSDIIFFPLKPIVMINNDPSLLSATITLTNDQGQSKTITVTNTGQVNIK